LAYPFAHAPTFADFKRRLCEEFACKFGSETLREEASGADVTSTFFYRESEGEKLVCPIVIEDEQERPTWTVIRSTCKRLNIDPANFGINLSDFP
jgi:hypothetical protein